MSYDKNELLEDRAASDMLEDALHHFDNIIDNAAASNIDNMSDEGGGFSTGLEGVALLMEDLRNAVEATLDAELENQLGRAAFADALLQFISPDTLNFYRTLFKIQLQADDSTGKLQNENESLSLQVNVLSDQVDLQREKLNELEADLHDALSRLEGADIRLQEEVAAKTSLETQKLQLLNEVSNCKITMVQQQRQAEQKYDSLQQELKDKDSLIAQLHQQLNKKSLTKPVTSPDEGIVTDEPLPEQAEVRLRMPNPCATSTPVAHEQTESKSEQNKIVATAAHSSNQNVDRLDAKHTKSNDDEQILNSSPATSKPPANKPSKASSTPDLAMSVMNQSSPDSTPTRNNFSHRKKHGFRKFFNSFKLRRSHSTSLESRGDTGSISSEESDFQRGGVRATVGPTRWNPRDRAKQLKNSKDPAFQVWTCDRVCQWLDDIGLHAYVNACRKWVKNGDTLLRATNHELEKELGIKHTLHKKKLMLHLQSLGAGEDDDLCDSEQMNGVWVARWLDDIGLPQYKDSFHEACMDGCLLHYLTVSDAQKLKITNLFHLISLRRAIEKLRACRFDPGQLRRRPVSDGESEDVSLWTNHRVMEWLRTIDLAEYAPNLRGSGVHGALMVIEPMFSSETLASLLNIPTNKTLLRRHLSAKLDELLPPDSVTRRKERTKEPGYQPLNIAIKYKVGRRSFGTFGRFRGVAAGGSVREFGSSEYVCPMSSKKTMSQHRTALETKLSGNSEAQTEEVDTKTTQELTAFSKEITTLTNKWTNE